MYPVIYLATELSRDQYLNYLPDSYVALAFNGYLEMGNIMRNGL